MEATNSLPGFSAYLILLLVFGFGALAAIISTSFLKIVIVLHILKSALGLQEAPPRMAINALAMMLSVYIMAPVALDALDIFKQHSVELDNIRDPALIQAAKNSSKPLQDFLQKHADKKEKAYFISAAEKLWPEKHAKNVTKDSLLVLIPAFTVTQLKEAFEAGFLIYLPFIVIDLIVSNILLSLGMMMVSPIVISLPFKLLLFVLADGWSRLLHSLVLSFQ